MENRRTDSNNYKPVSLTTYMSKVIERIVWKKLITFLGDNDFFPEYHHGFSLRQKLPYTAFATL